MATEEPQSGAATDSDERRGFLSKLSNLAMLSSLAGGYGLFAFIAGRFLYPARGQERQWMFVIETDRVGVGESVLYRAPAGETVNVTRRGDSGDAGDFLALSSVCPHLGCQVHWEATNNRYFCPCHNGVFTPEGKGVEGPPGDAGMELPRYELKVENGLLFVDVPVATLASGRQEQGQVIERVAGVHGPGHDPCLNAANRPGGDVAGS
jgi:nitrite reductase/ring-hydroxylating ferredoxin subunit